LTPLLLESGEQPLGRLADVLLDQRPHVLGDRVVRPELPRDLLLDHVHEFADTLRERVT
jgi:hypothetical protein